MNTSLNNLSQLKNWKLPLLALIGLIFALISVFSRSSDPVRKPLIVPPSTIYQNTVAGIGVVEPKSEVINLGTDLPGIVRKVYVKVGDHVVQGAPLFTLDERDVDAQIKTLKASLESSKIQLQDAVSQFSLVKNMGDSPAVAKDDFNRRKYGAELASKRLEEAQFLLAQAETRKERLTIKAPISGKILYLNVRPGELAVANDLNDPLISMGDMSTLHVRVEIDEENASLINPKSTAIGMKRSDTKTEIPLEFVRFEPYVKPKKNLAAAGQRVDTRVLQIIYRIGRLKRPPFVGEQMDVFIERQSPQ